MKLALTWLSARRDLTIITMKRAITLPSIILIALLGLGAGCHAGTSGTRVAASSGHGKRHVPTASLNSKRPTVKNSGASRTGSATSAATERCRELLPLITRVASEFDIETSLLVGTFEWNQLRNDVKSPVGAVGLTSACRQRPGQNVAGRLAIHTKPALRRPCNQGLPEILQGFHLPGAFRV